MPTTTTATVLVLDHEPATALARIVDGRVLTESANLPDLIGWELKPEGLCHGDACVPIRDASPILVDGLVDVAAAAQAVGMQACLDLEAQIIALAPSAAALRVQIETMQAPDFSLPDLDGGDHSLSEYSGKKKMLLMFSSWCGCRYDLPAWRDLQDELADHDFTIIAVALDENADDVRPFVPDESPYPVLIDRDHVLTDKFGVINVPTVVWIDEHDTIVKPADVAFGDNQFKEFHGVDADPHKDALRTWVTTGVSPIADEDRGSLLREASATEEEARLWFRIALHLRRQGDEAGAERNFQRALAVAPIEDFTIRRAAMPLRGEDPFGEPFFALYEEWERLGKPYYPQA